MRYLPLFVLCMRWTVGASSDGESQFRVRRRSGENRHRLNQNDDFFLTFSEDGKSKTLNPFTLVMYKTPSQLQEDAIAVLRMAMNKFLLAEFNALYFSEGISLESVGSEVFSYESTTRTGGRSLEEEIGTDTEMEVTLTFDYEPSPTHKRLEQDIITIMANLTYFVGNLTAFGHSDWEDVYEAYRLELPSPSPTPVDETAGIQEPDGEDGGDGANDDANNSEVGAIASTTLVAAALLALVVFLLVQRKSRRSAESESPKGRDSLFTSVVNDLYSMDRSLESSPSPHPGMVSPAGVSSIDYSTSVDESVPEDSVFSGIDYTPSNYPHIKGTKSLLSGFTNASAATLRASNNMEKQQSQRLLSMPGGASRNDFDNDDQDDALDNCEGTPRPAVSDVHAYSNSASLPSKPSYQDVDKKSNNGPQDVSPARQDGSMDKEFNSTSFLPACYGTYPPIEPATSTHVLADLEDLANSREHAARDPTPTAAIMGGSIYSNLFSCRPTLPPVDQDSSEDTIQGLDGRNNSPEKNMPTRTSATKTPLIKNDGRSARTPTSTTSPGPAKSMLGRGYGGKEPDSPPNRRRALSDDESALRRNAMPLPSGSKSAPTTPERNRYNPEYPSMVKSEVDENLSYPNTRGSELAEIRKLADYDDSGYGCYPFRLNRTAPLAPGETPQNNGRHHSGNTGIDGTSMYQTSAMNRVDSANGRRHAGNTGLDGTAMYQANTMKDPLDGTHGRRHAGNTGIDGTALYQENAMHPLEWSYKSADLQSIGESTLSENEGAAMPRQFLFGGNKDKNLSTRSPGREPKTPASQRSGKSATSGRTNASSQGSARRQLVNDLVWLEKKIADVKHGSFANDYPAVANVDSLSYVSDDNAGFVSVSSSDASEDEPTVSTGRNESVMSSIVCRDCYAPPGKLHIVIHSTKDGPAVHTVKPGSSLEGHIFPGDLIISVDNVDTRSFTAEKVMKMMASRSNKERKITVLHFEGED